MSKSECLRHRQTCQNLVPKLRLGTQRSKLCFASLCRRLCEKRRDREPTKQSFGADVPKQSLGTREKSAQAGQRSRPEYWYPRESRPRRPRRRAEVHVEL